MNGCCIQNTLMSRENIFRKDNSRIAKTHGAHLTLQAVSMNNEMEILNILAKARQCKVTF